MAIEERYHRILPPWYWKTEVQGSTQMSADSFQQVLKSLWTNLLRDTLLAAVAARPLVDCKAAEPHASLDPDCPSEHLSTSPDLIAIFGTTTLADDTAEEPLQAPFSVHLGTRFLDFPNSHHIRHDLVVSTGGTAPDDFSLLTLLSLPTFTPHRLRIAADFFASQRFLIFGYTPAVQASLWFELTPRQCWFAAERVRLPDRGLPLDHTMPALTPWVRDLSAAVTRPGR